MLKIINATVVFVIELVMFGAFAYFGFQIGDGGLEKYAFALALPLLAVVIWAYWAAPKSKKRLAMPYLAVFRLFLFLLAAYLLYRCGQTKFALILAVVSAVTQTASVLGVE